MKLYFDSATHRLAKIERRLYDEVPRKRLCTKSFSAIIRTATEYRRRRNNCGVNGKKTLEMTVTEVRYPITSTPMYSPIRRRFRGGAMSFTATRPGWR